MLLCKEWPATDLALAIGQIDRSALVHEYRKAVSTAPRRHDRPLRYFMPRHDGRLPENDTRKRFEEHLAIAVWRIRDRTWPRPDEGWFQFLDYQCPLYDAQRKQGVRAIDLLGIANCGRLVVTELKVAPSNGRGDSPMKALMQGLRYAAIVEANSNEIAREAANHRGVSVDSSRRPIVQILAPKKWWRGWFSLEDSTRTKAGWWEHRFAVPTDDIESRLDIAVECLAMDDIQKDALYQRPSEPTLPKPPTLHAVRPGEKPAIIAALSVPNQR